MKRTRNLVLYVLLFLAAAELIHYSAWLFIDAVFFVLKAAARCL